MNTSKERIGRTLSVISLSTLGALGLTSCSEPTVQTPASAISVETIQDLNPTTVKPGETSYIEIIDPKSEVGIKLISASPTVVDHIYPNGSTDANAPVLGTTAARFKSEVTLSGSRSDYLDNDAACDIINIEPGVSSISAIALGGVENGTYIAWPTKRGEPSSQIELCYFQDSEPVDGIILVGNREQ